MRILIVDDEAILVKGIRFNLENEGYDVDSAFDGKAAVEAARAHTYDAVILDLMMPELDGLEACRQIREFSNVPIIMLTAKDDDTDKLIGFEYGADDYITKPFNILELKARLRALLRRAASPLRHERRGQVRSERIILDTLEHCAIVDGQHVNLTSKEFDLIEVLMKNPNRVYSREDLLEIVWGGGSAGEIRAVDVHVRRLREKLEENPAEPKYIITKWGVGYYFKI